MISNLQNSNYQNSEYQSSFNIKKLKSHINENNYINTERILNPERTFDAKQKLIQIFKNKCKKDNILKSDFIPNQKGIFKNNSRKIFSNSNINKYNDLNIDRVKTKRGNLYIYKRPKKILLEIKKIPQINNSTSYININQNFIFPINNYLNNSKSYKRISPSNNNHLAYSSNKY